MSGQNHKMISGSRYLTFKNISEVNKSHFHDIKYKCMRIKQ